MFTSLKHRIIALCIGLVVLTATGSLAGSWWSSSQFNERKTQEAIRVAQNVYTQYLQAKERLLLSAANVLTSDFGFKQAVATKDAQTIASVLFNHSQRINADLMLLLDTGGRLISANQADVHLPSDTRSLMRDLLSNEDESTFIVIDERLYQAIILPVKAPRTIAFAIVGFAVTQNVAVDLRNVTGMEVSFVVENKNIKVSSMTLPSDIGFLEYTSSEKVARLLGSSPAYANASVALPSLTDSPVNVILSANLKTDYAEFDRMVMTILGLSLITVLLGFIASGFLARNLTRPLSQLTQMAKAFAKGNYHAKVAEANPSAEICALMDAFHDMGDDIQSREAQIRFAASHDALTGFLNRSAILEALKQRLETNSPQYLIGVDIKGLRHINDKLGPRIGDRCITLVSERIKRFAEPFHAEFARLGGDELLFVCEAPKDWAIERCVTNLKMALEAVYQIQGLELSLRFSIGALCAPVHGDNPEDLLRRTLIAADNAAQEGVNVYYYQTGEDEAHLARLQLIDELKLALAENDGQLFMAYQPKLNMRTQIIDKVESLIRWRRNNGEWVSPEMFIDLAEQSGLIVDLTQWVISTVVAQIGDWQRKGIIMKAAINVSAQDIVDEGFIPHLQAQLLAHQVPAKLVTIELTERDMIENEAKGIDALNTLKALGVVVSLDDYGVGQTSLGRLKMLPIDELKLDKVFILKLNESRDDQCIVQSTISLGHQLGFSVVAEGVENQASLTLLRDMGCDYAQGYYLSRPLPALEFEKWLGNYNEAI
ncbi:diguanylate cyclase/phosphodiesterase (GGDEF & EAL domains) with PAS/PAC sensor(s) [Pseudoalteromonas luteoviolacea B = ATCC 29581]|nr:diguanylate cyclase/phosphodiesterase (GGDEF & EAL domains) with PAS/PAC sensor(s) [Pseudoalteromonas luteoviolacea B = ATCC 29581]